MKILMNSFLVCGEVDLKALHLKSVEKDATDKMKSMATCNEGYVASNNKPLACLELKHFEVCKDLLKVKP